MLRARSGNLPLVHLTRLDTQRLGLYGSDFPCDSPLEGHSPWNFALIDLSRVALPKVLYHFILFQCLGYMQPLQKILQEFLAVNLLALQSSFHGQHQLVVHKYTIKVTQLSVAVWLSAHLYSAGHFTS